MFNLSSALPARTARILLAAMLVTLTAPSTQASGISGSGPSGGGFTGSAPREVDQLYEYGKSIYLGRTPGTQKVSYCVKVDGEVKKLRGRHLRNWRGRKQLEFANALYNCKQPERLALIDLEQEQVAYVLYYLNKRYKLELAG